MSTPLPDPPLPPKPQPPVDYDCCGGGCADCELKLYARALALWKREVEARRAAGADPDAKPG